MMSWIVSWLSLKTKVKSGLRESQIVSGDWRMLDRVRGVFSGSPENHWVAWLIHKAKTEELKMELQQTEEPKTEFAGFSVVHKKTGGSDRWARMQSGDFEAEDTRWDRRTCVEAKQVCSHWASVQWSDDKDFRIRPRGACIPN
jgi:hypothetical protein